MTEASTQNCDQRSTGKARLPEVDARVVQMIAPLSPLVEETQRLKPGDGAGELATRLGSAVDSIKGDIALVLHEHQGMTDELLRVYEQVGIVFDLTPRLLGLRSEQEVIDLLVQSLQAIFSDARFGVVCEATPPTTDPPGGSSADSDPGNTPAASWQWHTSGDFDSIPGWIEKAITDSRRNHKVCVVNEFQKADARQDRSRLESDQVLLAPLFAGDSFVCEIVLWRAAGGNGWESGDMLLMDSLAAFCGDVIRNFRLLLELQQMSMEMVRTLVSAVDQKDPYTSGHSNRVGYYAQLLGAEVGLGADQLRTLEWSALLHDVGKIGIRDDVLKKTGKLTHDEFDHIKEHPLRGFEVVRENPHMREAVDGVLYHHEKFDGTGYPKGLKGEDIPHQARIIQVADIFDALTTTRSYRKAFHWLKALGILQEEAGTVVDPHLCEVFVGLLMRLYKRNPVAFESIGHQVPAPDLAGGAASPVELEFAG